LQTVTAECRVADLEILRAGGNLALVYARDNAATAFYHADVVELLLSCRQFRTIDQHAQLFAGADAEPGRTATLRRELHRLVRAGFLLSRDGLRLEATAQDTSLAAISSVGFPTRDRIEVLHRAISSYAEQLSRHGRRADFVVVDDSAREETRKAYRSMLHGLENSTGIEIAYAGLEQKLEFARKLAELAEVPEEVVRFGCLGEPGAGVTIGANRNALLLHTVGEPIFSADDDTVCRLAAAPEQSDGLELDSAANPLQLWFFRDRKDAFAAVEQVEEDLLGLHEQYLGRQPAPLLAGTRFDLADPALLWRLQSRPGRIRVTTNGTTGDCGWDNPDFHLFQEGPTFDRLVRSEEDYRAARATRNMVQAATGATITGQPDPKFAMCLGLDNTELLPPFPPVGRAEEVGFGALLTRCFPDAYAAHLPWLVRHDPVGQRQFSSAGPFAIGLGSWLPSALSRFDPGLSGSPTARLRGCGGFLTDLSRLAAADFDEFVRLGIWDSMSALIQGLEERLETPVPDYWARDAQRYIAELRRGALAPMEQLYSPVGGRNSLQRLLAQFGQLLSWWPAIVTAARQLRADGQRLARPVAELRAAD
jgi:hypothetical protein